jgi:hypothetical protein
VKGRQIVRQGRARAAQSELEPADLPDAGADARLDALAAANLTMDEAAVYLRYQGERRAEAALRFLRQSGVRVFKRGRLYLVRRQVLDALMEHERGASPRDVHAQSLATRMRQGKETFLPQLVSGGRR